MLHLGTGPEYASQTFAAKERISYRETDSTVYRRMQDLNAGRMDETALICYDKKMSYRTLIEQADRIADLLTTLGVRKDDLIMLAGEGCAQTVSILLACSKIGVGIMMLQPKTPEETFNLAVSTVDIPLMFCESGQYVNYAGMKGTSELSMVVVIPEGICIGDEKPGNGDLTGRSSNVILWDDFLSIPVTEKAEEVLGGNYPLTVCSTTGSTGIPKGIVMPNSSYIAVGLKLKRSDFPWEEGDSLINLTPPYIVSGTSFMLLVPMMLGMAVLLEPRRIDMPLFLNEIVTYRINHIALTKSPWLIMAGMMPKNWDLSSIKGAYTVGEPISESEYELINSYLRDCGSSGRLQNFYGLSEANSILTCATQESRSSAGRVMFGDTVAIFDIDTQEEKKLGEAGELYFRTPSVMKGYLYNPMATREFFIRDNHGGRWCRTGDIASVDPDGEIRVYGRLKEKFTAENGAAVFPYMIEKALSGDDTILRVKMVTTSRDGKPVMAVHVVPKVPVTDPKAYADRIHDLLKADASLPALPGRIKIRPMFPMNSGGKLDMIAMAAETDGFFDYD